MREEAAVSHIGGKVGKIGILENIHTAGMEHNGFDRLTEREG